MLNGGPPLKDTKVMQRGDCGLCDVTVEINTNMAAVRWKDKRLVNVLSSKDPIQKVKRYSQEGKKE